ncbi:MAG: hypothetical protein GYA41_09630 [Bacteroidales bacterium]|nr:hypothetical protein [Bacteroidales bacterium]
MKKIVTDNKINTLLGPSGTFAGYSLILFGTIGVYYDIAGLILVFAGIFMALTFDGTLIDYESRRIKGYTSIFGIIKIGKWHSINDFTKFIIYRSWRRYTTYSRANIPLDLKTTDIRLALLDSSGRRKIIINKYNSFEAARNDMSKLIKDLDISNMSEWTK